MGMLTLSLSVKEVLDELDSGALSYCWFCCENVYKANNCSLSSHMDTCKYRKEAHGVEGFHTELVQYLKQEAPVEESMDDLKSQLQAFVGDPAGEGKSCLLGPSDSSLIPSPLDRQHCTYVWYHRILRSILYVGQTSEASRREAEHRDKKEESSLNNTAVEMVCIGGLSAREAKLLEAVMESLFGRL